MMKPEIKDELKKETFDSDEIYRQSTWGEGYFQVNAKGHLCVSTPVAGRTASIDIHQVVKDLEGRNMATPLVLRFHDVLRHRIELLHKTFAESIRELKYPSDFIGVYPVKVNQMREVVEEIVDAGRPFRQGLEAGSKAELLSALAYQENPRGLIVINGYKDEEFISLALQGSLMGHKVIIVLESLAELELVVRRSRELQIRPSLGFRGRLSAVGQGIWGDSSGDNAKFGMSASDIVSGVDRLRDENLLDCLELFHFHAGSQISDINYAEMCITEGTRMYVELRKMGAAMQYLDIGGGLAVDYDGTRSNQFCSMNYTLKEYSRSVLSRVQEICRKGPCPPPHIITESGRFLTAHHSCVITNVIGLISASNRLRPERLQNGRSERVEQVQAVLESIAPESISSCYHSLVRMKNEALESFKLGLIGLEVRAQIESLYWEGLEKIHMEARRLETVSAEIEKIPDMLRQQYLCNFSVFQSTMDAWAIRQLLPIMPIHRLDEEPTVSGSIADITCDSYGKICNFFTRGAASSSLPLHAPRAGENYYIGIFLTGAYQDVMGDMHNLFGRVHEAHVYVDDQSPHDYYIEEVIQGSNKEHVLATMQYDPAVMKERVRQMLSEQQRQGKLDFRRVKDILDVYGRSMQHYTYLEGAHPCPES